MQNNRNINTPNEIIINSDYAEVVLYNKKFKEIARSKIDVEDIHIFENIKCRINNEGYVIGSISKKSVYIHRIILDCPREFVVDHLNHDKLDNRKSNLKISTCQQNCMNKSVNKNSKSGVIGVFFRKSNNKWRAQIKVNGKSIHLGEFVNINDAIFARKQAEIEYFNPILALTNPKKFHLYNPNCKGGINDNIFVSMIYYEELSKIKI